MNFSKTSVRVFFFRPDNKILRHYFSIPSRDGITRGVPIAFFLVTSEVFLISPSVHTDGNIVQDFILPKRTLFQTYFFCADVPYILSTMLKMKELGFVDIDLHLQVVRFRMTLIELVQHRENSRCKDTAKFIPYHGTYQILHDLVKDLASPTRQYLYIRTYLKCNCLYL